MSKTSSACTDDPHQLFSVPSIEEQFKDLPPSRELIAFYRNKLEFYEEEFERMREKLNVCRRICGGDGEIRSELRRCNDEVFTLQKALSDVQVYLNHERNQVMKLQSQNDLLKIQAAKDRENINLLLSLCNITEDQLIHLINNGKTEWLQKGQELQTKCFHSSVTDNEDTTVFCEKDPDMLLQKVAVLESQLKKWTIASQDEIYTLHKDREVLQMEREKEYQRLQDQISALTDRLTIAHANICELTSEIVALKVDLVRKEEKSIMEKERKRHRKHSSVDVDQVPENYELQSKLQRSSMLNVLKDQLQHKEKLIKLYKMQCVALESELCVLNNSKELTLQMHQVQVEKLNKKMTYMKEQCHKLIKRRSLEAEGFRSDVKMLKERFRGLERKLASCNYALSAPQRKELLVNSREIMLAAKCLEKELVMITNKLMNVNLLK